MREFVDFDKDRLMAVAALFGNSFSLDWLTELTTCKPGSVLAILEEGIQHGILDKQPGWFLAFKSPPEQKALAERLSLEEKEYWHGQIANLLFRELPNDVQKSQMIADHLYNIRNDLSGCRLLLNAAVALSRSNSFTTALSYYQKAFDDLSGINGPEADHLFIETALKYTEICSGRVAAEKAREILQEAGAKARRLGLRQEISLLETYLGFTYYCESLYGRAIQCFDNGWEMAKSIDDPVFRKFAGTFHTFSYFCKGQIVNVIRSYEESVPVIENLSMEYYQPVLACAVGLCYGLNGLFSQGLGLVDAIRKHCLKNDHFIPNYVHMNMAFLMIHLHRPDDALSFLNRMVDDGDSDQLLRAGYIAAFAHYLKGEKKEAFKSLKYCLERRRSFNIGISTHGLWFELCKAMEEGELPRFEGIRLEDEINFYIEEKNILIKGIAYRYKAFIQEREKQSIEKIVETLALSSKLLEEAGAIFEQCRSLQALIRQQILRGDQPAAEETKSKIRTILGSFSHNFVPNDLRAFIDASAHDPESLIEEILNLSQDMSTIRDEKRLMQRIISTSNRITGAERGAIFGIKKDGPKFQIGLKATRNISAAQTESPTFASAQKMIEEVVETGKGRIARIPSDAMQPGQEQILSQICVPMVIRNKVVGALYHDNSIIPNSFKDEDLKLLGYFGTQAAIALDHAETYTNIQSLNKKLYQEKQYYKEQTFQDADFKGFIGRSPCLIEVMNKIRQVADTETTVLILGETGVGKEMVARALHNHSSRQNQPFIKVLCNALPESLIGSELFGHEKGAFTGSLQRRIGRFELADGGTLFLDEIGDLPFDIQTTLLRVLQSKEFERVGGSQTIRSDFRLITATNRDLEEAVRIKKFREDLYYRLNVFPIYVPPLNERIDDIPLLTYHFFKIFCTRLGKVFDGIPQKEMNKLLKHDWPGNIRELEGVIERAVIMSKSPHFRIPEIGGARKRYTETEAHVTMKDMECSHILRTMERTGWKLRGPGGAAEALEMNYSTLCARMRKLGIVRPSGYPRGRRKGT